MVKPAAVSRSTMGRVKWQPPASRYSTGSRRRCQRRTGSSGASPCSRKCRVPPGFTTRRISLRAAPTSGIVHSVQVDSAASKLSSGNGSDCPSSPERYTGTVAALTRSAASRQPRSDGSTAVILVTAAG